MGDVMKMTVTHPLNLPDRIHLLSILPQQGDATTLRIVRELREQLSLTEEDHKEFQITSENAGNGQTTFHFGNLEAANAPRPFEFKPKALAIIVETLKRLDQEKQLSVALLPLYEAFVEE